MARPLLGSTSVAASLGLRGPVEVFVERGESGLHTKHVAKHSLYQVRSGRGELGAIGSVAVRCYTRQSGVRLVISGVWPVEGAGPGPVVAVEGYFEKTEDRSIGHEWTGCW